MTELKKRIIELSHKHKLSHLGSCLTCVPILDKVYEYRYKNDEPVILDNGHAGLALYTVIEKYEDANAEELLGKHGIHPTVDKGIYCSTGSLGLGGAVAFGHALANPFKNVYTITSDGSLMEGVWWETLRNVAKYSLYNYKLLVNCNGYGALSEIDIEVVASFLRGCGWGVFVTEDSEEINPALDLKSEVPIAILYQSKNDLPFLKDLDAHYHVMNEEEYMQALKHYEDGN